MNDYDYLKKYTKEELEKLLREHECAFSDTCSSVEYAEISKGVLERRKVWECEVCGRRVYRAIKKIDNVGEEGES